MKSLIPFSLNCLSCLLLITAAGGFSPLHAQTTTEDSVTVPATEVPSDTITSIDTSIQFMEKTFKNKTRDDLYREFFNIAPPQLPKQMDASLIINNETVGPIDIVFSDDRQDFSLPVELLISRTAKIAVPELVQKIRDQAGKEGRITKSALTGIGLSTVFDQSVFQVRITVPSFALLKITHHLSGGMRENPYSVKSISPAFLSAYLNVHANQELKYRQILTDNISPGDSALTAAMNKEFRQPVYCNIDGAVTAFNTVLEGMTYYQEDEDPSLQRRDVRLVYDRPKNLLRFSAGDIRFAPFGNYQSNVRLGGVSISKDYSLQPHILTYPVGEYEFQLTEPAEVEVWVDDIMVKRMHLEAGTHDIRGFPFSNGYNRIKLLIRDYSGRNDTVHFSFLHQASLLGAGKSKYSLMAGFINRVIGDQYTYFEDKPCLSLAYRRGVTNWLTCDASSQAFLKEATEKPALRMGMMGMGGLCATPLGKLELNTAAVLIDETGIDFAGRFGYTYQSKVSYKNAVKKRTGIFALNTPLVCKTQVEYMGKNYARYQQDKLIRYIEEWKFSSDLSIPLVDRLTINFGGRYHIRRDTTNYIGFSMRFHKNWIRRLSTNLTFLYSSGDRGYEPNPAIMLGVHWAFRAGSNDISVSEEIKKHRPDMIRYDSGTTSANEPLWDFNTGFQWNYDNDEPRPEKIIASTNAQVGPYINDYSARLGYAGNCGSIETGQLMYEPQDSASRHKYLYHQTNVSLKTALVYAGNTVSLSRPVYNGFAIVKGTKNLNRARIVVNPTERGYDATGTMFGPAVLPLYSPYQLKRLELQPQNSPLGTGRENLNPILFPQYKSGFLIKVGSEKNAVVIGTLLGNDGKPFVYKAITVMCRSDKNAPTVNTFTNSAGRFQFLGSESFTYGITPLPPLKGDTVTIVIPKPTNGVHHAGTIQFTTIRMTAASPGPQSTAKQVASIKTMKKPLDTLPSKSRAADSTGAPLDTTPVASEDRPIDFGDASTYVMGTIAREGVPVACSFMAAIALDDIKTPWVNTFTDSSGQFQVICPQPGRYKIIVAMAGPGGPVRFSSTTMVIPPEKRGYFYHLGELGIADTAGRTGSVSPLKDTVAEKTALFERKTSRAALLGKSFFVMGRLVSSGDEPMGYTSISVASLSDTMALPIRTFTRKDGSFQVICPTSGRYRLWLLNRDDGPEAVFNLSAKTEGILDIGIKKLEQPRTQKR
ncbi:MAG: hypothetical protein JW768_03735 [Chitinispirillaceae bacterium]|nr:hypothetical protein [Chitinispirillaceae bacterium]